MKLYIAEKPSLGRAIADVLPKPHRKADGCIYVGNGDCVSWCIGHLLEQAEPEAYDPAFKKWQLEHLPILPERWKLKPKPKTRSQLAVLRKLIKDADKLVHAGDPDREGQLLVDQVIDHLGVKGQKKASIQRCLINDMNPSAVKKALEQLRPNTDFVPLSVSALARTRADWLYGINMTRAYTIQGRKVGYDGLLSVGRVQTPVLGLVARRDEEIEKFASKPFYEVFACLKTDKAETFKAKWQPSEACEPYQDEDGRVLAKGLAENVIARIGGQPGSVIRVENKKKTQAPPLPYSLSALQIDAAKRFGMSAKAVLDVCQKLYEQHKLITYPRSDSRYLPNDHHRQASAVLDAIAATSVSLRRAVSGADATLKSKAWNDSKVDAHHAIIPTLKKGAGDKLGTQESKIYELIARQYLFQFYPKHEYSDARVDVEIAGGLFVAKARQTLLPGWKTLMGKSDRSDNDDEVPQLTLPDLQKGDSLLCEKGELVEKQTQPPKYFTDATLLAAMTGIARFVTDVEIRKILKETDGLGTEATRAGIIELLFKRDFLRRQGKQIHATDAGRGLIRSLPEVATTADMTARWESELNAISERNSSYQHFMGPLVTSLSLFIDQSKASLPEGLKGVKSGKPSFKRSRKKAAGTRATGLK